MGFVQIPVDALSRQALDGLIEEFVTRDGTDYGTEERSLDDKKDAVRRQLDCGEIVIVFDPETETSNIISKDDLRSGSSRLSAVGLIRVEVRLTTVCVVAGVVGALGAKRLIASLLFGV